MNKVISAADMVHLMNALKGGEGKKEENGELFALLLAALSTVQAPVQQATTINNQEISIARTLTSASKIQSLINALPEGVTVEQLLLNIPTIARSDAAEEIMQESLSQAEAVIELPIQDIPTEQMALQEPKVTNDSISFEHKATLPLQNTTSNADSLITSKSIEIPTSILPEPTRPNVPSPTALESEFKRELISVLNEQTGTIVHSEIKNNASPSPFTAVVFEGPAKISAETLQQLRTEIVAYTNNPTRPSITLEVTPPEYGRIMVRADSDSQGQVTIRLVVTTPQVKEAVLQQLPPALAGSTSAPTTVAVYTAEEYREYTEDRQKGNQGRERRQRRQEAKEPHQVEFVI